MSSFQISPNPIDRTSWFKWHLPRLWRSIEVCLVEPFVHWMSPSWPHIWCDIAYYTVSMLRIIRCNTRLSKSQRYNRRLPWSTYGVILLTIRRIIHMIKWPLKWKLKNSTLSNSFTIHYRRKSELISRSLTIYTYTGNV